jgi:uncharacterized protein (TIGR00255 family)
MIKSMTGFGKATGQIGNKFITVEIKSLNSKTADISFRISNAFRNYELGLRNEISKLLERGKIDLSIFIESTQEETPVEINLELAKAYQQKLATLSEVLKEPQKSYFDQILKMPDVIKNEKKEADQNEWKEIKTHILSAINALDAFRKEEGQSIKADFETRLNNIENSLNKISSMDELRVQTIKERIKKNISDVIGKEKIDQNRFEQELIYYIEKLDINEEKVRLKTHLDYFKSTMKEASSGRKLNFITQEIGREINTIGSKANDAEIQKLVVMMKDELEKLKEQSNNVL